MEQLKIGFITDKSAPIYFGGYEIRVLELANRLARKGHEVHVYTTCRKPFTEEGGTKFYPAFPDYFQRDISGRRSHPHSLLFSAIMSKNPMDDWKPDYLVVEAIPYLHLLTMRAWVRDINCVKILDVPEAWHNYNYFGGVLGKLSNSAIKRLLQIGLTSADVVTAISGVTANSLKQNFQVDAKKVSVVPCGVDLDRLLNRETDGIPALLDYYDFVTVGRLVEIKRHRDFIDALSRLKFKYGWTGKAAIIGGGPLRQRLMVHALKAGVADRIDFLGFVSDEEKIRTVLSSKIFVLTSEREGFSIATLEAMALGLPVIVAVPKELEVFGTSEFVSDHKNGVYYPVGNIARLAEVMHQLLDLKDTRLEMGNNGKLTASKYDWKAVTNDFETCITNAPLGLVRSRN
ncbi:MAG: glycosyltransferase family 4 protein [Candidatus Thermoplasmatota archaeon]|nr:glycosyltransferase family 4 protein [Candidatus Thermoplasmatota archaeon]